MHISISITLFLEILTQLESYRAENAEAPNITLLMILKVLNLKVLCIRGKSLPEVCTEF